VTVLPALMVNVAGTNAKLSMFTALAAGAAEIVGAAPSVGDGVIGIDPMPGIVPVPGMPGVTPTPELNVGLGWPTG
jgi:hypothetical protein